MSLLTAVCQIPGTADQTDTCKKEKQSQNAINRHRFDTMVRSGISLHKIISSDNEACNTQYGQYNSK